MHFQHFLTYDELTQALKQLELQYPDLIRTYSIGQSSQGRDLWCAEIAGARTGHLALEQRPGFYIQGNIHAEEFTGSLVSLYLIEYLGCGYRHDPQVTDLLDQNVFYIVPRVALDGAEHVLKTGQNVRSKVVKPRGCNVLCPQDINGDGLVLLMRWQSPDGNYVQSEKNPRIMLLRERDDQGPFFHVMPEGVIREWDNKTIQRVNALCDFNRNFPAGWTPKPTVQDWGAYPLCEPETRAIADFILAHPNIVRALDLHNGNPAIFYPYALVSKHAKHKEDAQLIAEIGHIGEEITGYRFLSGYPEIHGGEPQRLPGSFKDWMYEHQGIPILLLELGLFSNWHGFSLEQKFAGARLQEEYWSELLLQWHDQHPEQELFYEWTRFDHPQLGEVELGGWNRRIISNPPLEEIEGIGERVTSFVLRFASYVPQLQIQVNATLLGEHLYKVTSVCRNVGKVATYITQQGLEMHPYAQLRITLTGDKDVEFITGAACSIMPHLHPSKGQQIMEWVIRTQAKLVNVTVMSERGIYSSAALELRE